MFRRIIILPIACLMAFVIMLPLGAQTAPAATTAPAADKPAEAPKPAAKAKLMIYDGEQAKVQLYGFIKLDASYNTTGVAHEAGPMLVDNQAGKFDAQKEASLSAEARNTRLGLNFNLPDALGAKLSGNIEVDFWGQMPTNAAASNQSGIRMRHAYMKLDWPTKTYLLVGQYWSTAMAYEVLPQMATFVPMGKCGLLFAREQQITVGQKVGDDFLTVGLDLSAARVQAGNDSAANTMYTGTYNSQVDEKGAGEASGIPGFRGKLSVRSKPINGLSIIAGGTGFFQKEKQARAAWNHDSTAASLAASGAISSANISTRANMVNGYAGLGFLSATYQMVGIAGHFFYGANMDTFLSIAGTFAVPGTTADPYPTDVKTVKSMGGWGQGTVDFRKLPGMSLPFSIAGGYGCEALKDKAESKVGSAVPVKNECAFGNVFFYANQYLTFMAEVARMETEYNKKTAAPAAVAGSYADWRYELAAQLTF